MAAVKALLPHFSANFIEHQKSEEDALEAVRKVRKTRFKNDETLSVRYKKRAISCRRFASAHKIPLRAGYFVLKAAEAGLDGVDLCADTATVTSRVGKAAKEAELELIVWVWSQLKGCDSLESWKALEQVNWRSREETYLVLPLFEHINDGKKTE